MIPPIVKNDSPNAEFLFSQKGKRYCSATVNMPLIAKRLGSELADMPQTAFRVWFALMGLMKGGNHLDTRLKEISDFCRISISSAHRAMEYLEKHNLITRKSTPNQDAQWIINPELMWNSSHHRHQQAVGNYKRIRRETESRNTRKKKEKDIKNNTQLTNCDTIPIETTDNPGDAPCASKLKAA